MIPPCKARYLWSPVGMCGGLGNLRLVYFPQAVSPLSRSHSAPPDMSKAKVLSKFPKSCTPAPLVVPLHWYYFQRRAHREIVAAMRRSAWVANESIEKESATQTSTCIFCHAKSPSETSCPCVVTPPLHSTISNSFLLRTHTRGLHIHIHH